MTKLEKFMLKMYGLFYATKLDTLTLNDIKLL